MAANARGIAIYGRPVHVLMALSSWSRCKLHHGLNRRSQTHAFAALAVLQKQGRSWCSESEMPSRNATQFRPALLAATQPIHCHCKSRTLPDAKWAPKSPAASLGANTTSS